MAPVSTRSSRFRRRAQARAEVRKRRMPALPPSRSDSDATWDPTGTYACGTCGRLEWPAAPIDFAPHRHDGSAPRPCPHCGHRGWIRLDGGSMALRLREAEAAEPVRWHARLGIAGWFGGGALGSSLTFLVLAGAGPTLGWVAVVGGLLGTWGYLRQSRARPEPATLPRRWRMVLPGGADTAPPRTGGLEVNGDLLTAPLSGRRCAAYEVAVRSDGRADASLSTFALVEQRMADVSVSGHPVDPALTHLALPRRAVGRLSELMVDAEAAAYLRSRGFGVESSADHAFEGILEPGDRVELAVTERGATLRVGVDLAG